MKWYRNLYIDETIKEKKLNKIKWKLNHNAGVLNIFLITLASNSNNLLDIINAAELKQKAYPKDALYIIGIAKGYDSAIEITTKIIMEVLRSTDSLNIKKFIEDTGGME